MGVEKKDFHHEAHEEHEGGEKEREIFWGFTDHRGIPQKEDIPPLSTRDHILNPES
jgi:hypothetical protein